MALQFIFVQVILTPVTTIVRDEVVNTFTFVRDYPDQATAVAGIFTDLKEFYNTQGVQIHPLSYYYSPQISRVANASRMRFFAIGNLDGTPPSMTPIEDRTWTLGAAGSGATALPSQIAVVLSLQGDVSGRAEFAGATRPKQRRRGRMYLGPLTTFVISADAGTKVAEPDPTFVSDLIVAAGRLKAHAGWYGWSRADADLYPYLTGWVDTSFDVVRRRKVRADARTPLA